MMKLSGDDELEAAKKAGRKLVYRQGEAPMHLNALERTETSYLRMLSIFPSDETVSGKTPEA